MNNLLDRRRSRSVSPSPSQLSPIAMISNTHIYGNFMSPLMLASETPHQEMRHLKSNPIYRKQIKMIDGTQREALVYKSKERLHKLKLNELRRDSRISLLEEEHKTVVNVNSEINTQLLKIDKTSKLLFIFNCLLIIVFSFILCYKLK